MNALIKTENGFYCSTVYAYNRGTKWGETVAVVFDQSNTKLVVVHCDHVNAAGHIHLTVLFADGNKDNWVKCGEWEGIDFIVNNKDLLKSIESGDSIPLEILDKCLALQTTETFSGWNKIDSDADIQTLMNISGGFHDGYIESIETVDNVTYVKFKCWSCYITIEFTNMSDCNNVEELPWEYTSLCGAVMHFDDGNIEWCADGFNCCIDDDPDPQCYFVAEKAQYKIEFE